MTQRKYENAHERRRAAMKRRREREGWAAKPKAEPPKKLTPTEAVLLYRAEKAKRKDRDAQRMAEVRAAIERAVAKADADKPVRRGGRPRRLKDLYLTSDKVQQVTNALARKAWQ